LKTTISKFLIPFVLGFVIVFKRLPEWFQLWWLVMVMVLQLMGLKTLQSPWIRHKQLKNHHPVTATVKVTSTKGLSHEN
jgi:hypothetical protein